MTATIPAAPIGKRLTGTVAAGGSLDLDTNPLANTSFLRYFLSAKNAAGTLSKSMDISVNVAAGVLSDCVFGRKGQTVLPLEVAAIVDGTNAILRITNPNLFSVDVEAIRLIMG